MPENQKIEDTPLEKAVATSGKFLFAALLGSMATVVGLNQSPTFSDAVLRQRPVTGIVTNTLPNYYGRVAFEITTNDDQRFYGVTDYRAEWQKPLPTVGQEASVLLGNTEIYSAGPGGTKEYRTILEFR